jgi:diguanylate cyclase (GGDEF)-like protein
MTNVLGRNRNDDGVSKWSRAMRVAAIVVALALIFEVDTSTGAAPFQHLYYLPIVAAGLGLPAAAGPLVGLAAVVLYHLANPALLASRYRESDVVQIALFIAIGLVTATLAEDRRQLRRLSETDDLTGLSTLRGFDARLKQTIRSARQSGTAVAVFVLDVDRLKSINDTHGHMAGADAVRTVGHLIAAHLADGAFACRFGGDEFVVALPGRALDGAKDVAERLRRAVHAAAPTLAGAAFPAGTLSISVGLACREAGSLNGAGDAEAAERLFRAADQALYVAKGAGRNQVSSA